MNSFASSIFQGKVISRGVASNSLFPYTLVMLTPYATLQFRYWVIQESFNSFLKIVIAYASPFERSFCWT